MTEWAVTLIKHQKVETVLEFAERFTVDHIPHAFLLALYPAW